MSEESSVSTPESTEANSASNTTQETQSEEVKVKSTEEASNEENSSDNNDLSLEDLELLSKEDNSQEKKDLDKAKKKLDKAETDEEKEEAEKEVEKALHKYKLKIDGKEEEVELSEDEIVKELQLARKARKEIQESSELKKELSKFFEDLKANPFDVLQDPVLGLDIDKLVEERMAKKLEDLQKDPAQLEKEKLEAELEELRAEQKRAAEERQRQEYEVLVEKHERDLEEKTQEALESSGLPKTPYVLKRMADVMMSALQNDKDISPKQALNIVNREMRKDLKEMFQTSPEDLIEELLGKENIKRINKRQLERLKEVKTLNSVKDTGHIPEKDEVSSKEPTKKMTINEWLRK